MGVALESVNGTKASNLEVNKDKEYTPNHKRESLSQEQEQQIIKGTKEAKSQGKHQGDQGTTQQHFQVVQHTNAKVSTRDLMEKQQDKREKAIWKVKERTNISETNNICSMEKTGKSVNFASENIDHKHLLYNNPLNNQNEQEKGHSSMQAAVNDICDLTEKAASKGLNMDTNVPPPIKISKDMEANKKGQGKQMDQNSKETQQNDKGTNKTQSNRQDKVQKPTEDSTTHKEEQWQTQTRRKNKSNQHNQEQGKSQNSCAVQSAVCSRKNISDHKLPGE
ncbi:hypothetical protein R3W88_001122 [Solanum pinnatisectum]|uniref:Uncharacterized protein n=1 Tax=Solanum pinnatisectum TaxID=50273 RepID=A0AAV9MHD1_9SOLN|nr:hypothetical protein R3W88_001122 [Solanum pinnatisectum]